VSEPDPSGLNASLRRVQYSVLGTLVVCALVIGAWSGAAGDRPASELPQGYLVAAIMLAGTSILVRRSVGGAVGDPRAFVVRSLVSLLLAGGLGLLGVAVTVREGHGTTGFLYAIAGGLLAIRPPPRLTAPGASGTEEAQGD
jgi:hypothetical protein